MMDSHIKRLHEWEIAHETTEQMHQHMERDFDMLVMKLSEEDVYKLMRALRKVLSEADGYQAFGWDHTIRDTHPGLWRLWQAVEARCFRLDNEEGGERKNEG